MVSVSLSQEWNSNLPSQSRNCILENNFWVKARLDWSLQRQAVIILPETDLNSLFRTVLNLDTNLVLMWRDVSCGDIAPWCWGASWATKTPAGSDTELKSWMLRVLGTGLLISTVARLEAQAHSGQWLHVIITISRQRQEGLKDFKITFVCATWVLDVTKTILTWLCVASWLSEARGQRQRYYGDCPPPCGDSDRERPYDRAGFWWSWFYFWILMVLVTGLLMTV